MVGSTAVKEGKTTPPKHYTEDTLLSAMEVAGAKEMPEDAERNGLGTPATRAAILEKLVATGFVERKKSKKTVNLIPTHAGISLITVLPEQLQSPLMTAEWEHRLKEIERGEESPETFMQGIRDMVCELVKTYKTVLGADVLFPSGRAVVGKCPRCGSDVTESKKGYFCERNDCHFGFWRSCRKEDQPDKEDGRDVAERRENVCQRHLLRENRQDLRCLYRSGRRRPAQCV